MKRKRQKRKLARLLRSKQVRSQGRVFARIGNLISLSLSRRFFHLTDTLLEAQTLSWSAADPSICISGCMRKNAGGDRPLGGSSN